MKHLIAAAALAFSAFPAMAGGFSFDLPRLDFPAPTVSTSRGCATHDAPGLPTFCETRAAGS
jgi:hypothetical protein